MISYTTTITSLVTADDVTSVQGSPLTGVVVRVQWTMIGVDSVENHDAKWYGTSTLDTNDIDNSTYVLFGNLTEEKVLEWLNTNNAGEIEAARGVIERKITQRKRDTQTRNVPW
jgi:hypothetical protein